MENIFFDIGYTSFQQMLIKILVFLLVGGLLLYGMYFVLAKFFFRRNKHRREINLRLVFLWSIFACFLLFNVYIFLLFYIHGVNSMDWTNPEFYLGIAPQIIIYIGLSVYFLIQRSSLNKIINEKSIY